MNDRCRNGTRNENFVEGGMSECVNRNLFSKNIVSLIIIKRRFNRVLKTIKVGLIKLQKINSICHLRVMKLM